MAKYRSITEMAEEIRDEALDNIEYKGITLRELCDKLKSNEYVPVVRGEWKPIFKGADTCECSVCKREGFSDSDYGFIATPYCPNCGAKMDKGE